MVDSVKLIWTNTAINDRQSIYDYIELDNPIAANHLDELFSIAAKHLIDNPLLGKAGRVLGTRELVVHQNYLLVYEVIEQLVVILAVVHARKNWPPLEV